MGTILLFEHEASSRMSLSRPLAAAGFSVRCAHRGLRDIAEVSNMEFDAAIVDVAFSDRTEGKVAHALRERDAELPIFVCTRYDAEAVAEWAVEDRMLVIEKPVDETQLIWLLRAHLGDLE